MFKKKQPDKNYKICKTTLVNGTEYFDVYRADGIYDGFCLTQKSLLSLEEAKEWLENYKQTRPKSWEQVYSELTQLPPVVKARRQFFIY